jgi:hypothetical protein
MELNEHGKISQYDKRPFGPLHVFIGIVVQWSLIMQILSRQSRLKSP